jgi:hypothetical protein
MLDQPSTQRPSQDEAIFPDTSEGGISISTGDEPPKAKVKKRKVLAGDLKGYCWRLTAAYTWLRVILGMLGWHHALGNLEHRLSDLIVNLLSAVGIDFAPVSSLGFVTVFKIGWVLIITGVRPWQLIGLFLYILIFPVSSLVYAVGWVTSWEEDVKDEKESQEAKRGRRERMRILISALLLFSWLLLYGNALTLRQIIPGLIFSGALFLLLTMRLFQRARPESDERFLRPLIRVAHSLITSEKSQIDTLAAKYKDRSLQGADLKAHRTLVRWIRTTLLRLMPFFHGKRARARLAMFVLLEFMLSLLVVAASAVLFWAIAIKAVSPNSLSLLSCLQVSVSRFLPSIPPFEHSLPFWTSLGPAVTSWILFVLYIGPASSLLPKWQDATLKGFATTYDLFRKATFLYGKVSRWMKRIEKKLPLSNEP